MEAGSTSFSVYPNSFSPSGNRLLLSHESSVQPGDFWIYDIASRSANQLHAYCDCQPEFGGDARVADCPLQDLSMGKPSAR
jgi:hypothetical protein